MENYLIKYLGKKCFFWISIFWLITQILFIIIASILINPINEKLINILLIVSVNSLILLIIYGFSISSYTYETIYQIKTKNTTYDIKFFRYLIILFGFAWLIFFILNALYMLIDGIVFQIKLDYFVTLSNQWWKLLIVTFYNIFIIVCHRELMHYVLKNCQLPWNNWINKKSI